METERKIALITGGSRGLGRAYALRIAQKGIDVILTYNRQRDEALAVVKDIEEQGGKAAALQLNVGDVAGFDTFFTQFNEVLATQFGARKIDFLVNNAGVASVNASILEATQEQFDTLINVHYKGVYFLIQKILPLMNDGGGIINFSSGTTHHAAAPNITIYASVKGAIEVLTLHLAKELGPRRIRVNTVAPGATVTDFGGGVLRSEFMESVVSAATALGRIGHPDDVSGVVAFLCTDEARWVNAQRIEVSGGMNL